jgi:allantoinase
MLPNVKADQWRGALLTGHPWPPPPRAEPAVTKSATAQGFRIHVAHLSDAEALPMLKGMRKRLPLTAETCPHYLLFAAEEIPNGAWRRARGREGFIFLL